MLRCRSAFLQNLDMSGRRRLSPPYKKGGVAATRFLRRRRGGYLLPPRFNFVTSPSAPYKTGRSHPSSLMRRGLSGRADFKILNKRGAIAEPPLMLREAHP